MELTELHTETARIIISSSLLVLCLLAEAGDGTIAPSLEDWRKQSSDDQHSIAADPVFAMAAMGDFRLLPMSPAVNAGAPLQQVRQDFFGDVRPKNSVSMGACQTPAFDFPRPARLYRQQRRTCRRVATVQ